MLFRSVDAGLVGGTPGTGGEGEGRGGCLNPGHPQTHRVYGADGTWPTLEAGAETSGQDQRSVCIALDGDKLKPRADQRKGGNGFGVNEDGAGYTVTATDRHGVAYGIDQQGGKGGANTTENVAPTVLSDSHGTPHGVAYGYEHYEQGGVKTLREECEPCLSAGYAGGGFNNSVVECFENHATDARTRPCDTAPVMGATRNGNASNNNPLVVHKQTPFVKTRHASGKDGEGEKWEQCEVAGTRNAIEGGDGRSQECIVSTNSNGEDVAPTLDHNTGATNGIGAQNDKRGGYVITRALGIGRDVMECGRAAKFAPDIREEASPTLRAKATTGEGVCVEMKPRKEPNE